MDGILFLVFIITLDIIISSLILANIASNLKYIKEVLDKFK